MNNKDKKSENSLSRYEIFRDGTVKCVITDGNGDCMIVKSDAGSKLSHYFKEENGIINATV